MVSGDDPSVEMAMAQKLMAMVMVNELDFLVVTGDYFESFAYQDFFLSLDELDIDIPEELLLYSESSENPEVLPYGIDLGSSPLLKELGLIQNHGLTLGVVINTIRPENVIAIINLLLYG